MMEGLEDVGAAFVADDDPTISGEPGQAPLDHPAVSPKTLGAVDPAPCDPRLDGAPAQRLSALREVIALIGMELGRPSLRSADAVTDWRHSIDHCRKELAIVAIGRAEPDGERDAVAVHNDVALASWLARSVGFGPVPWPPLWRARSRCPRKPGSSRWHWPGPTGRAGRDATGSRRRRLATRATAASTSSPTRNPSPGAASPRGCRSSAQTGCHSAPPGAANRRPATFRLRPLRR